jgi:glutamate racemase
VAGNPIAVFDSGLGGLSVVRELRRLLPGEDVVYFGDTARVPYGIKSRRTVANFALEDARFLLQFDPKLIVAACNTASALAMDELDEQMPLPVVGVIKPGARAAVQLAEGGPVAVIGTEATISSGAYTAAIRSLAAQVEVIGQACPLFVPLVEEGRGADDPIVKLTVETYLSPLRETGARVIVLGCTHYPLLREAIAAYLGPEVQIVESGCETARAVHEVLQRAESPPAEERAGELQCYVSDNPTRFRRIGSRFLDHEIEHVELVEPEQYIASAVSAHKKD